MPPPSDATPLPVEVARFLRESVDSVEQCEILVTMHHKSERWWNAHEIGLELYLADSPTAHDLELLAVRGLLDVRLESELMYRLAPASAAATKAVRDLAALYRTRRVDVLSYVVREKGRALRHFAEAFRFHKSH